MIMSDGKSRNCINPQIYPNISWASISSPNYPMNNKYQTSNPVLAGQHVSGDGKGWSYSTFSPVKQLPSMTVKARYWGSITISFRRTSQRPAACFTEHLTMLLILLLAGLASALVFASPRPPSTVNITNEHPLIYYHGRWDSSPGTWWTGSGFKLNVENLKSLALNLGPHTTSPFAAIGVSLSGGPFFTFNASEGVNDIPLSAPVSSDASSKTMSLVRINVEGSVSNRINLQSISLNSDAIIHPYHPSNLTFQVIGDSFSSGYLLPMGVDQAWPFILGETYGAEHRINAQPGAALTDIPSYGNIHGISYQYFKTEDTNYYYTTDHNYTTPWNFRRDEPPPTHIIIHIGANDSAQNVTDVQFIQVYSDFLDRIRVLYPVQPIFVMTPWGWPYSPDGVAYYYQGDYQTVVNDRIAKGDKNIFIIDATGWITYADVFPDSLHPTGPAQFKIANNVQAFLENWGLSPPS